MQTTSQTEYIDRLLGRIDDMKARIQVLRGRIVFLEERLEQREQVTVNHYRQALPYLKGMRDKIFKIFLETPANMGLSYPEIIEEFSKRYPSVNTKNVPRRVRELVTIEHKLWSKEDEHGTVRFYLMLKEMKNGESS